MEKTCSVVVCDKPSRSRGLCQGHYERARNNGWDPGTAALHPRARRSVTGTCSFEGCGRKVNSYGLCWGHDYQRRKGRDLKPLRPRVIRQGTAQRNEVGERLCTSCNEYKSLDSFYATSKSQDGYGYDCLSCLKAAKLLRAYSIDQEAYDTILADQGGGCAICGGVNSDGRALAVDHNHACCAGSTSCGQCVRGLLCANCNVGIGMLADSSQRLRDAASYLDRFSGPDQASQ